MDRSFGATTSVLHTPSPLDRRGSPLSASTLLAKAQLAQSIAPSASQGAVTTVVQPLSFNPQNVPVRSTTSNLPPSSAIKAVRFSPAHASTTSAYSNQYSSAPSSRIQGFATPPRSYSPSLLRTATSNHGGGYALGSGTVATPPRHDGQSQQGQGQVQQQHGTPRSSSKLHLPHLPVQAALAKSSSAVHAVQDQLSHAGEAVQSAKAKLEVMPLGRGEAARRLRVNAVLLVAWWVSSRTTMYRFAAGHLVAAVPQLDAPLHVCETLLLLLLCYNIIDSFRTLNKLSSLPASTTVGPFPSSSPARPTPLRAASSNFGTPVRSSPKTRASPSPFKPGPLASASATASPQAGGSRLRNGATASPFRASALASDSPPTPRTPTSALRGAATEEAAAALRRSLGRAASPAGTPLGLLKSQGAHANDDVGAALAAFEARHAGEVGVDSPRSVKVESREDVERLFGAGDRQ
ncbi:hypothetical protein JCM3770_002608 [Rhodotorula araucariae]